MAGTLKIERLRSLLSYDPEIGVFTWLSPTSFRTRKGGIAGTINKIGYRTIRVDGKIYYAHRLAWFYVTGRWPEKDIDHENLNKADNRFLNLREATMSQNLANIRVRPDSASGIKGVKWDAPRRKWATRIKVKGCVHFLGRFESPEEASAAYRAAAKKYFGEFARAA